MYPNRAILTSLELKMCVSVSTNIVLRASPLLPQPGRFGPSSENGMVSVACE
jgi:hypothetical protein